MMVMTMLMMKRKHGCKRRKTDQDNRKMKTKNMEMISGKKESDAPYTADDDVDGYNNDDVVDDYYDDDRYFVVSDYVANGVAHCETKEDNRNIGTRKDDDTF
ncbi:hypothetical protein DPMN_075906 [Dreissena polymorpha]|uniref:Uncharacterized protein n=1 Tax=Dreissena polymorpha TaxID=45954 RepID=A0A9D3YLB2_DREPO|nr:hypothetical protein DPMN_075906 [Dreissena polymorpha]